MTGKLTRGVIHGKTIELTEDLGLTEGQEVEVRVTSCARPRPWGEGILRSAGGWADYPEMDAVIDQIQQDRKLDRRPQGLGMSHLLDTNICAAHFRRPAGLAHRFMQYGGGLFLPTVVLAELVCRGVHTSPTRPPCSRRSAIFSRTSTSCPSTRTVRSEFGKVRGGMLQRGIAVPVAIDLMIASVALVHDLTLVTHNTADFRTSPASGSKTGSRPEQEPRNRPMIEPWVLEKLAPLRKEPVIILRDPQRMIRRGARAVDGWAEEAGFSVLWVSGNLGLRELYEQIRDDPSVRRSCSSIAPVTTPSSRSSTPTWRAAARHGRS